MYLLEKRIIVFLSFVHKTNPATHILCMVIEQNRTTINYTKRCNSFENVKFLIKLR